MKYSLAILLFIFFTSAPGVAGPRIWDRSNQKFISEQSLMDRLAQTRNILMGLQLDNADHYNIAAGLVRKLVAAGRQPTLLLGTIERSKQNAFAIFARRPRKPSEIYDATGLDMLLDWPHSSLEAWATVRPIFDVAMLKKLPLRAVAFSRYEIGKLYHDGPDRPLEDVPDAVKKQMAAEIHKAYCTDLPPEVTDRLIMIDRAQSRLIAQAIKESGTGTAILVGPKKYILQDSGVPSYLKKLKAGGRTVSLLFSESGQKILNPEVDFIWFTDKIPRPDPCRFLNIKRR